MGFFSRLLEAFGWSSGSASRSSTVAPVHPSAAPERSAPANRLERASEPASALPSGMASATALVEPEESMPPAPVESFGAEDEVAPHDPFDSPTYRGGIVDRQRRLTEVDQIFLETFGRKFEEGKLEIVLPPAAAMDVMRLVDDPHCSMADISDAIARDPALAGSVIKQANSVVYRGTEDVLNLHAAVVRLGQRNLRMLLLSVVLGSTRVRGQPFAMISDLTWRHSLLTAKLSQRLAARAKLDPELAYMAGLFHNVGVLAILSAARSHASDTRLRPTSRGLIEVVQLYGYRTNTAVVQSWGLPEEVAHAVTSYRTWFGEEEVPRLACLTELANDVSKNVGLWVEHLPFSEHLERQLGQLGLSTADLPSAPDLRAIADDVEQTAQFL